MKSHTSFENFFTTDSPVELVKNCDLSYFRDCGYVDYRVGCTICERGDAYGFKTNLLDLIDNDNVTLNIRDLNIITEDDHKDTRFPVYYETKDKNTIKQMFEYFKKMNNLSENFNGTNPKNYLIKDSGCIRSSGGISSIFVKENSWDYIENTEIVNHIHICDLCFKWLNIIDKDIHHQFQEIDSFKIFWENFMIDYLHDIINDHDKFVCSLFKKVMLIPK